MSGEIRSVTVRLSAAVAGYVRGMGQADAATAKVERGLDRLSRKTDSTDKVMGKVGKVGGRLFLGAAAGIAYAEKKAADFNSEMATVNTLSHANQRQQEQLAKAAKTVGINIGVSATESAKGEQELIKAGVSLKDILGGGLKGALDLAAAGQTDVGTATEVAASAMTQFKLKGKDVPHIADLLAAGADKALGSVTDLGYGLSQVGTQAHQMGFSIEDTVGTLAEFAQSGLTGERGGTVLKQMFLQLAAPTKNAQKLMDMYGVSLYNAQGQIKTMPQLADNLQKSFKNLTPAQRNQALGVIFGSRAIQGANILIKDGEKGNRRWIKSVNDQGFAAHQASGKMDSLKGDLKKLDAQLGNTFIDQGGKQGFLRGLTQDATKLVKKYNDLSDAQKNLVGKGFIGAAAVGGALWTANKIYVAARGTASLYRGIGSILTRGGTKAAEKTVADTAAKAVGQRVFVTNWPPGLLAPSDVPVGAGGKTPVVGTTGKPGSPVAEAGKVGKFGVVGALAAGVSLGGAGNETHPVRGADKLQALDTNLAKLSFKDPAAGAAQFNKYVEKSGKSVGEMNKLLPKTASALDKTYGSEHALNTMLQGTARAAGTAGLGVHGYQQRLLSLPSGVQTKITSPGFSATSANIRQLKHQYDLTPRQLRTLVRLLGGPAAIAQANAVESRLNRLQGKSVNTYIHTITSSSGAGSKKPAQNLGGLLGKKKGHATGGYIAGPGGPRDDQIPAWLSNGEFVVNAAATASNRALLEAINGPGTAAGSAYAAGGAVVARRSRADDDRPARHVNNRLKELQSALKKSTAAVTRETTARDALVQKRSDLVSAVTDKFTTDPFASQGSPWSSTAGGADSIVRGDTAKAKQLLTVFKQLHAAGLTSDAIASVGQAADPLAAGKSLLASGVAGVKKYQADFNTRAATVGAVAKYAGTAAYSAQQAAATAELKSLNAQVKELKTDLKHHHAGAHSRAHETGKAAGDAAGKAVNGAAGHSVRHKPGKIRKV